TTLARVIAGTTSARFVTLNAVTSGVADIRKEVDAAREAKQYYSKKTVLFIDEIHRFTKSQQDALLPYVEEGLVILIGATTENPYFEVNPALLSRSQIFRLSLLTQEELQQVMQRALSDAEHGLGSYPVELDEDAREHLIRFAQGDARRLLGALELAVLTTPPDESNRIRITLAVAEESIQERAVNYDKTGDQHYDTISAFIKAMRGSDPDATLFWLAKMLHAGEDPKYILRRILVHASEDVGNADPRALQVAVSAFQAFEVLGMPEGKLAIAQAALYVATAPKSNAVVVGINNALSDIAQGVDVTVPVHLRDAHYKGAAKLGHGQGYLYPHNFPGNWVQQNYLPEVSHDKTYYQPTRNGYEAVISDRLRNLQ
ncbi:MAG: family ATPase, partial [Bacilli bacterium]|nr:family ATPase [Bacilli bacterium]